MHYLFLSQRGIRRVNLELLDIDFDNEDIEKLDQERAKTILEL